MQVATIYDNISLHKCLGAEYINCLFQYLPFGWTKNKFRMMIVLNLFMRCVIREVTTVMFSTVWH